MTAEQEQCVIPCPQCEGAGCYADGLDEAACFTNCTRCCGNGWIVDLAALSHPADEAVDQNDVHEMVARALRSLGYWSFDIVLGEDGGFESTWRTKEGHAAMGAEHDR